VTAVIEVTVPEMILLGATSVATGGFFLHRRFGGGP
jgi:hypothetical protein